MSSPQQDHARAEIERLIETYNSLDPATRADLTEASVVTQFIEPLLRALGWPIEDPGRYKKELQTQVGRPDLTLIPESGGTIFVEAKRFGVIQELREARRTITGVITPGQLALPGMAADRTPRSSRRSTTPSRTAPRGPFSPTSRRLRLFNARRDWLVLSFERPAGLSGRVRSAVAVGLRRTSSTAAGPAERPASTARRRHRLSGLHQRMARAAGAGYHLSTPARTAGPSSARRPRSTCPSCATVVQRFLDRLVVVRFAEDHIVIKPGSSWGCRGQPRRQLRCALRLLAQRGHPALLPALRRDPQLGPVRVRPVLDEQVEFGEDVMLPLIGRLYEARYRSMPADIMGNTYEQYLGKALVLDQRQRRPRATTSKRARSRAATTPRR